MFLALLLVGILITLIKNTGDQETMIVQSPLAYWWTFACLSVLLVQILLGTNVREAIDGISQTTMRNDWIAAIGQTFSFHRSFSWIVLILHIGLIVNLRKTQGLKPFPLAVIVLILGTILSGAGMAYAGVPPWLQPVHLTLASGSFGMQLMLLLKLRGNVKEVLAN
jgi:cytochrome c oxidase assembly protein subunit 15